MKVSEAKILIVPGYKGSGKEHWQSRWEQKLSTAERVQQKQWFKPIRNEWVSQVKQAIENADKPVVLVAHSLGIPTAILALPTLMHKVKGGFFVAPPDVNNPQIKPRHMMTFGPYPRDKLPFPSIVIASQNDQFSSFDEAQAIANDWGALFIDAGDAGHLDAHSGYGPWPEGAMAFSEFLAKL